MPVAPDDLGYFVIEGHSGSGEIFNTGFYVRVTPPADQADWLATVTAAAAVVSSNLVASAKVLINSTAGYDTLRGYYYEAGSSSALMIAQAPLTGGVGTGAAQLPLQTCMVLSLRTNTPTARARGRMYLPAYGATLVAHQFSSTDTAALATAGANLFAALSGSADLGFPTVVSYTFQETNDITRVIVDSIPDVQRRRSDKMIATVTSTDDV